MPLPWPGLISMTDSANLKSVPEHGGIGRRGFLAAFAGGSMVSAAPRAIAGNVAAEIADDRRKARYRESDEVKTFYRVNRYPAAGE